MSKLRCSLIMKIFLHELLKGLQYYTIIGVMGYYRYLNVLLCFGFVSIIFVT